MKRIFLFLVIFLLPIIVQAQTKGVPFDLTGNRVTWYDSLHTAQKTRTVDLEMKYSLISIVLSNRSATIVDTVRLSSLTRGYSSVRPNNAVDFARAGFHLRKSDGKSISTDDVIVLAANTDQEYFVMQAALELIEFRLLNVNADAKLYFYVKALRQ